MRLVAAALAALAFALGGGARAAGVLQLTSPTFADGAPIPRASAYDGDGCGGLNRPPVLVWRGVPAGTRSFALEVFDPDARPNGWWHWVRFDIPASLRRLDGDAPGGTGSGSDGRNSFGSRGYGGPCPPPGELPHHYRFTLFALDVAHLGLGPASDGAQLESRLAGHVLARALLVGRYGRP
ncbi:MAG: YbhB/YbcL family Raf kinase inhibitor-like protein [Vulcanimicrobiaceae bacterium]